MIAKRRDRTCRLGQFSQNHVSEQTQEAGGEVRDLGQQHMKGRCFNGKCTRGYEAHGPQIYLFLDGCAESSECPFSCVSLPSWGC